MSSLTAQPIDTNPLGYYRVFAQPAGGPKREITIFRGAPVVLVNAATTDPFTESTAQISTPQITMFDMPGSGDLDWLVPDANVDIIWQNTGDYTFDWRWEGFIASYDFSLAGADTSFTIDLKGALFGVDNYIARPFFPTRPVPYELLISRAFDQDRYPCGLGELKITFPDDWTVTVPEFDLPDYLNFLKPSGVQTGDKWTGLTSRNTGSFEPLLSGHVQSLLTVMYDEGNSQWTIRNNGFRRPELYLRTVPDPSDESILDVVLGGPGVDFQATRDFSQRANTIYGQGKDEAGITYSGVEVTPDGTSTYFRPYAASPLVYPRDGNPSLDRTKRAKETMIRFQDGLDEAAATRVAQSHLQRFTDPGIAGTLTLLTDPRRGDGSPFPRMLIKAGATLRLRNILGIKEGLLVHVTQSSVDFGSLSVTLTVDSKYRDALTVDEVRARTRDALSPLRALQTGKFTNTVNDLLKPWNYRDGCGMVPQSSKDFFLSKLPDSAIFPYEDWTTQYPPKDYPQYYIKLGPTNTTDATKNWTSTTGSGNQPLAIPIQMAAAGTIKLSQIAAYDKNGNVKPVRFHVSLWQTNGVGPTAMPAFPVDPDTAGFKWLKPLGVTVNYGVGDNNPFFKDAFEQVLEDGTQYQSDQYIPRGNSQPIVGWGNYYEPAGYSPGRASRGADRTGLLVDNTPWDWDNSSLFDPVRRGDKYNNPDVSQLFLLIYCDEQGSDPIYFQGRFLRQEPGTQ